MVLVTHTDTFKYVIVTKSFPFRQGINTGIKWLTLVCPPDRNGDAIPERSVVSRNYFCEDEAYLGHLELYQEWNLK